MSGRMLSQGHGSFVDDLNYGFNSGEGIFGILDGISKFAEAVEESITLRRAILDLDELENEEDYDV